MQTIIIAILGILLIILLSKQLKNTPNKLEEKPIQQDEIIKAYEQTWMFTLNEKNTFYKLEKIAEENNMKLFAKVRLLDLVKPKTKMKKTYLWKIQAKHVDFVITTNNLVAKYIIELDDNSHNTPDRKERDAFVDNVLTACGYKVLRIKGVQEDKIKQFLSS